MEWKQVVPERNRAMLARIQREPHTVEAKLFCEHTLKEVARGWVAQPVPISDRAMRQIPLAHRFALLEQRGEGAQKVRIIDDLKASQINDLLGLADACLPESLGGFLSMLLAHGSCDGSADVIGSSLDCAHAYKHAGIASDQLDFATVILTAPAGAPCMASLRTQPFGPRRAPANWARVANFPSLFWKKLS